MSKENATTQAFSISWIDHNPSRAHSVQPGLHSQAPGITIPEFCIVHAGRNSQLPGLFNLLQRGNVAGEGSVKNRELSLIQGFWLCLRDSEAVRLQSSRWKRNLLVFSSGVCLEIALLPLLVGSDGSWQRWILPTLFVPLGLLGLYASKFGNDRLVEKLLVIPKLDLRI